MKILLINNNPVVSRLTALSARKEAIELDEIQEVTELSSDKYDIVFVDADSMSKDVLDVISDSINVQKKVLFFAQDDKEEKSSFDITILKPFLPSEVSAVIRSLEEGAPLFPKSHEAIIEESEDLFPNKQEEKEKKPEAELFNLDDDILDLPDLERKESKDAPFDELIKEESPKEEDSFHKQLEEAFPATDKEPKGDLPEESTIKNDDFTLKSNDDLFELDLNDDKLSLDEELFSQKPKNKELSLDDELLDFDFNINDELDFDGKKVDDPMDDLFNETSKKEQNDQMKPIEKEREKETKVLDATELANIKDILEEDSTEDKKDLELSDLMTTPTPDMDIIDSLEKQVEEKKKSREEKASSEFTTDVNLETLANLPIENLRKLLAGARVNISIKFPKD